MIAVLVRALVEVTHVGHDSVFTDRLSGGEKVAVSPVPSGSPVAFVRIAADGVPRFGVVRTMLVAVVPLGRAKVPVELTVIAALPLVEPFSVRLPFVPLAGPPAASPLPLIVVTKVLLCKVAPLTGSPLLSNSYRERNWSVTLLLWMSSATAFVLPLLVHDPPCCCIRLPIVVAETV